MALVQLAISVITGRRWFGRYDIPKESRGHVLLALAEEDEGEASRRLWTVREHLNLDQNELDLVEQRLILLPLAGEQVALDSAKSHGHKGTPALDALQRQLSASSNPWRLVVLDPLARWAGPDTEIDNDAATRFVTSIEALTRVPGRPTVLLAHHSTKEARHYKKLDKTSVARGAGALTDGARWMATLQTDAKEPDRLTFEVVKSNYTALPTPLKLRREGDGSLVATLLSPLERPTVGHGKESSQEKISPVVSRSEQASAPNHHSARKAAPSGGKTSSSVKIKDEGADLPVSPINATSGVVPSTTPSLSTVSSEGCAEGSSEFASGILRGCSPADMRELVEWLVQERHPDGLSSLLMNDVQAMLAHHVHGLAAWLEQAKLDLSEVKEYIKVGYPRPMACLLVYLGRLGRAGRRMSDEFAVSIHPTDRSLWLAEERKPGVRATRALASVVWDEDISPWLKAAPLASGALSFTKDRYLFLPKLMIPLSWAWGADRQDDEPVQSPLCERVEKRNLWEPHLTWLSLECAASQRSTSSDGPRFVVSPQASKLLLWLVAHNWPNLITTSVSKLACLIQGRKIRVQKRDIASVIEALHELAHLKLCLDDQRVRMVHVDLPSSAPSPDGATEVRLGLTPWLRLILRESQDPTGHQKPPLCRSYCGWVLVNIDGLLRLNNKKPALLRYYLRCAALWNYAQTKGEEMEPREAEEWGSLANHLHRGVAIEFETRRAARIAGKRPCAASRHLTDARAKAREHLRLLEHEGLLVLRYVDGQERSSTPRPLLPLPPSSLIENRASRHRDSPDEDQGDETESPPRSSPSSRTEEGSIGEDQTKLSS